ncbi:MAG: preprotein translocase subunit SecG [Desulfobulbaceae bacterium]|nr:preprotein translocase subunit SecG [Desulfobulbaceae bacterium]
MTTILIVLHVLVCFFLIGIVLLQQGKGADIGATFGGSSQSLFGTEGPLPLLNKITTLAAIIFMATSVSLAYISANKSSGSVMSKLPAQEQQIPAAQAPAVPEATQPVVPVAPPAEVAPPDAPQQQEQGKE